ncbi:MAG: DinB family protein [Acidobacteriota bacterium]|nr:DinB family protein [Acidobacteriota bacterium]
MEAMTPAERERLTNYLSQTRSQLLETVRSLSPEQLDYKPNPDRWSIAQVVEHVNIVEGLAFSRIDAAVKSATPSAQSAWQGRDETLVELVKDRSTRVQAPERGQPTSQLPHEELFRQFDAARNRTIEFAAKTEAPLRSYCFPHPIFGEMDAYQWLLAAAAHSDRHCAQILEVMADASFPRAAATV